MCITTEGTVVVKQNSSKHNVCAVHQGFKQLPSFVLQAGNSYTTAVACKHMAMQTAASDDQAYRTEC